MTIGSKIKKYRQAKGYTLKQLSEITKLSVSFISDIEHNRSNPGIDSLNKFAKALDVSTDDILGYVIPSKITIPLDNSLIDEAISKAMDAKQSIDLLDFLDKEKNIVIHGEKLSPEDIEVIKSAIEQGYYLAKRLNKPRQGDLK